MNKAIRSEKSSNNDFLEHENKKFSVTIGIPAYNERGRIGSLLRQVLSQNNTQIDEIIVNTSGSNDGTQDEVISVAKFYDAFSLIKIIDKHKRAGKAAALDDILKTCHSDIVIFLDGDVKLHKKCLKEILKPFVFDDSVGVVSGNVISLNENGEGLFSFISRLERQLHHELCMNLVCRGQAPKVNGTFFALRTNVVNHLPHYVVSDDEYVSCHAQSKGYRVAYASNAIVYTKDPGNCRDYIAKRRRIFAGHSLIKKTIGYTVPTTRLTEIIPALLKFSIREKKKVFHILALLLLQFASYILAISDITTGNVPYRYRVESAKF